MSESPRPGFVVAYIGNNEPGEVIQTPDGFAIKGDWKIQTEDDGRIANYSELNEALDRVNHIRERGGEACLLSIIE